MDGGVPDERRLAFYATAYSALLAAVALAAVVGNVWHSGLLNLYLQYRLDKWAFTAYAMTITVVLVLAWLVAAVVLEHVFSHAPGLPALRRTAVRVLLAEAGLLAASAGVFWLLVPQRIL